MNRHTDTSTDNKGRIKLAVREPKSSAVVQRKRAMRFKASL